MRTLVRLAVRLYPAVWRTRYASEFHALLDDLQPGLGTLVNVTLGALRMQLAVNGAALLRTVALGGVGLAVALCLAFFTSRRVESSGTMRLRRASVGAPSDRTVHEAILEMASRGFSDQNLEVVIERQEIRTSGYRDSTAPQRFASLAIRRGAAIDAATLRGDIRIWLVSPEIIKVAFASNDSIKTQQVTGDVMALLAGSPDLRSGTSVEIIDPAGLPRVAVSSRRLILAAVCGLGAGLLLSLAFGLVTQPKPHN